MDNSTLFWLRVQNEQFSEEKGFILRDTEKEVYVVSAEIRIPHNYYEANSLYHWAIWLAGEWT